MSLSLYILSMRGTHGCSQLPTCTCGSVTVLLPLIVWFARASPGHKLVPIIKPQAFYPQFSYLPILPWLFHSIHPTGSPGVTVVLYLWYGHEHACVHTCLAYGHERVNTGVCGMSSWVMGAECGLGVCVCQCTLSVAWERDSGLM